MISKLRDIPTFGTWFHVVKTCEYTAYFYYQFFQSLKMNHLRWLWRYHNNIDLYLCLLFWSTSLWKWLFKCLLLYLNNQETPHKMLVSSWYRHKQPINLNYFYDNLSIDRLMSIVKIIVKIEFHIKCINLDYINWNILIKKLIYCFIEGKTNMQVIILLSYLFYVKSTFIQNLFDIFYNHE